MNGKIGPTSLVLTTVGALNWGLVGVAKLDLVAALLGGQKSALSRAVYTLVGVAGAYTLWRTLSGEATA
jgi:uncharacterized membrane protein YuzA (DUF378 family)